MAGSDEIRLLFAGGGTAGHLMPAINIAMEMTRIESRIRPLFVGRRGGIEKEIVQQRGFEIAEIDVIGMKRTFGGVIRFMLNWNRGSGQSKNIVRTFDPHAVVGTGGYVAAPTIRAAHKLGKRIFIQEQNSIPGLATRSVARFAELIFIAYESAGEYFDKSRCVLSGNPIRPGITDRDRSAAISTFGLASERKTVLVLGGSGGASSINNMILELIETDFFPAGWQLLWQTGNRDFERLRAEVGERKMNMEMRAFIDDIPSAYACADLVVSRAGAMALSEITAAGLPSILIPYPHATGNHQLLNARSVEEAGAAIVVEESEMKKNLRASLGGLLEDDHRRNELSSRALKLGRPGAAQEIAHTILGRLNEV